MAKLNARGRYPLAEITREFTAEQLQARAEARGFLQMDGRALTKWERVTQRLMSDGTVLEKIDVQFQPDTQPWPGEENGRKHSYGWKVKGKIRRGKSASSWLATMTGLTATGKQMPYTGRLLGADKQF